METKVKICGITNPADARAAVAAGADALGFIFYEKSPRYVRLEDAALISGELAPFIIRVGVFVNAPEEFVFNAIRECGLTLLQFHGDEPPEYCGQFGLMNMKAFRVHGAETLDQIPKYATDAYLLDAYSSTTFGGTGEKFNWDLAVEARKFGKPIFLAGGLTPDNVADAIRKVQPFGVDVSSGVETAPGLKDHDKIRAFITAARSI
ncbi:MAG TPA: phosphoribosylanthranilate isomerase [Candidatus Acidoferrales bacterium]|jgi:phosphoribosylanthranilate isomerase|nr:phosphoribosylanthranilate isomerase [Candidatus Acidoferrales bacterium]